MWRRSYMHLDKDPWKLYTVLTEGGRNSDCTRSDNHVYSTPLSLDVLNSRLVGTNVDMLYSIIQILRSRVYILWSTRSQTKTNCFHLWVSTQVFLNLKLEQMSAKHFEQQSGYELWHRRLGYASFRNIRDTMKCVNRLEFLKHMTCDTHVKCPSCMIGKKTLEDLPKTKKVV